MPIKKQVSKSARKPAARRSAVSHDGAPKMVSFGRAISNFFRKYFQFSGVATRAEYWWMFLFIVVLSVVLVFVAARIQPGHPVLAGCIAMFWVLFLLAILVPWFAVQARRLHDAGFSAKLLWISLAFMVYSMMSPEFVRNLIILNWINLFWGIFMLVLYTLPSKKNNNPYRD